MASSKKKRQLVPCYNPVNQFDLVPFRYVSPWNNCNVENLRQAKEFNLKYKVRKLLVDHGNTKIVLIKCLNVNGYLIGKVYSCYDKDKKMMQKNVNKCWKDYIVAGYAGIVDYYGLYYDKNKYSLLILQAFYKQSLLQFMVSNGPIKLEQNVKVIANDILKKLWRLHNCKHVHTDITPNNIMERELDHLSERRNIMDGWLLIDFEQVCKNNTKGVYKGAIGWTSPEIEYNSNKNKYTYAADIFSFGLVILYMISGTQPLMLPWSERQKYYEMKVKDEKDRRNRRYLRKQVWGNHYHKCVKNGETVVKNFIIDLHNKHRMSDYLFRLLFEGILVYDPKKRLNCKQIYYSKWLADVN